MNSHPRKQKYESPYMKRNELLEVRLADGQIVHIKREFIEGMFEKGTFTKRRRKAKFVDEVLIAHEGEAIAIYSGLMERLMP